LQSNYDFYHLKSHLKMKLTTHATTKSGKRFVVISELFETPNGGTITTSIAGIKLETEGDGNLLNVPVGNSILTPSVKVDAKIAKILVPSYKGKDNVNIALDEDIVTPLLQARLAMNNAVREAAQAQRDASNLANAINAGLPIKLLVFSRFGKLNLYRVPAPYNYHPIIKNLGEKLAALNKDVAIGILEGIQHKELIVGDFCDEYIYELEFDLLLKRAEVAFIEQAKIDANTVAANQTKKELEEARISSIFATAKATGIRQALSSIFLAGTQIPKKYRDDDSDMGNLIVWALPNGKTIETFSHAH
jgi:hypothetical protein